MFVQVITGKVRDQDALLAQMEAWEKDLAPGADGWLGSTGGVTDDGTGVAVVRFESREAAEANSARTEQGAWWQETAGCFDGEPEFLDSAMVEVDTHGDPGMAGFVQVMQGRVSDMDRAHELMSIDSEAFNAARPDVLGTVWSGHDDGRWSMEIFFTSEVEARAAEQQEMPEAMAATMAELAGISVGETSYFDLRRPHLSAPR